MGAMLSTCWSIGPFEEEGFDGKWDIDDGQVLGRGKFAEVYMCHRKIAPEQRFALKDINTKLGDTASINRVNEEIQILKVLGIHKGIVSLVEHDDSFAGKIRLVLELCEGGELYDRIQQLQCYPEHEAKLCTYNLLEAVQYIHGKGIMHRDLKPENILLTSKVSNIEVKISDFGLAKISRDFPRRLPRSHSICGSDFYLAPEVIKQEEYGREIDIWALGVITYVLLSGSLPFFHGVLHKLYRSIVEREISFPEQAWKNVSKGALDFILRLMQVRAGDRLTADQALSHPWFRGTPAAATSFNSFETQGLGRSGSHTMTNPNYYAQQWYGRQPGGPDAGSQPKAPHPLEHPRQIRDQSRPGQQPMNPQQQHQMQMQQQQQQQQMRGGPPPGQRQQPWQPGSRPPY